MVGDDIELQSSCLKMCVFSMGWNMKHWTLLDIWVQIICSAFRDQEQVNHTSMELDNSLKPYNW